MKPLPQSPPSGPVPPDTLGEHDGVTFQRERLAPILREILPLIRKDWEENGIGREAVPLVLDYDRYLNYDLAGILQLVTARSHGALVGYIMGYVHTHIDHADIPWTHLTWYWLYPEYRGNGVGHAMLKAMETFLRASGIKVVEASEKITSRHGMFERNGYINTDIVKRKIL
ncbi:MAG: GNAT family N-acetyltransferase [Bradyrhizobium sp.]|nr:GNAT family N-acetyltransferase [Bradyrhizobium sp.]